MSNIKRRLISFSMAAFFSVSFPVSAFAIEADNSYGDVTIGDTHVDHYDSGGGARNDAHNGSVTVIHGSGDQNGTVYVQAGSSQAVDVNITIDTTGNDTVTNVVLDNANIDTSAGGAAIDITGPGDVVVELEGNNSLTSGSGHAGLETSQNGGSLTLQDTDADGSLNVQGGSEGAGIGGGSDEDGTEITITGGTVSAKGGEWGAGIGGGRNGDAESIAIEGGNITAIAGERSPMPGTNNYGWGAGIGGGQNGNGSDITISGGTVYAKGEEWAAGIGGGCGHYDVGGDGTDITITGGTVTAIGGNQSAGIGGGVQGIGQNISIEGGDVTAVGGPYASGGAGIGGGCGEDGTFITISGGVVNATGGHAASGIGGGLGGSGRDILISGGDITSTGGYSGAGIGGGLGGDGIVGGAEAAVGERITISGGTIVAESGGMGAGIGGGSGCRGTDITITGGTVTAIGKDGGAAIGGGGVSENVGYGAYGENNYIAPENKDISIWNNQTNNYGSPSSVVTVDSRFQYQSTDAAVFISDSAQPVIPEVNVPVQPDPGIPEEVNPGIPEELEKVIKQFTVTNKHGKEADFKVTVEENRIVLDIQTKDGTLEVKGNSISKLADAGITQMALCFGERECVIDIADILENIKAGDKVRFVYEDGVVIIYVKDKEVKRLQIAM